MTRKELTYAIGAIAGAVAGAGCAATAPSQALPQASGALALSPNVQIKAGLIARTVTLAVGANYPNTFSKQSASVVARSSDPTVCEVVEAGADSVALRPLKRGTCEIHLHDPATGDRDVMRVNCA